LNSSGKERGGSFLFSKACKSLYRRRFKEIEDAPLAAYYFNKIQAFLFEMNPTFSSGIEE
jgi:hypothetical protein